MTTRGFSALRGLAESSQIRSSVVVVNSAIPNVVMLLRTPPSVGAWVARASTSSQTFHRAGFRSTSSQSVAILNVLSGGEVGSFLHFVDRGDGTAEAPKPLTFGARTNEIVLGARRMATSLACEKVKKSAEPLEVTVFDTVGT